LARILAKNFLVASISFIIYRKPRYNRGDRITNLLKKYPKIAPSIFFYPKLSKCSFLSLWTIDLTGVTHFSPLYYSYLTGVLQKPKNQNRPVSKPKPTRTKKIKSLSNPTQFSPKKDSL